MAERSRDQALRVGGIVGAILLLGGGVAALWLGSRGDGQTTTRTEATAALGARLQGHPEGIASGEDAALDAVMAQVRKAALASATPAGEITIDYPLEDSVFPPEFVPPTFLWHDATAGADAWLIRVAFADGKPGAQVLVPGSPEPEGELDPEALGATNEPYRSTPYQASARSWTPPRAIWEEIKRRSVDAPALLTWHGFDAAEPTRVVSRGQLKLSTSKDPVGAPIFYRDVPLMPAVSEESGVISPLAINLLPLIGWRLRDVSRSDSRLVLTGMPSCANCHSFSRDGSTLGMDVDGPQGDKGTYAIAPIEKDVTIGEDQVITWNAFADKPEGHRTIGFLSRVSPDGKHVMSTVNEELYVANFPNYRFLQVFYPTRGILAWYSAETGEMKALPGADDPEYVHCNPVWSPDGKDITFCRAEGFDPYGAERPLAVRPNDPNEPRIVFDLYRIPFNGGKGGEAVPIEGASQNGMSNTFPKISPDGKWIVYTKCKNGLLMRPDGKLWIVPAAGGAAREMRCNSDLMNSWHSFSPNGRWLVFSSKVNTPYTQMFLTHVDEEGHDTPRILIPNATVANRAVNIPEFMNAAYEDLQHIEMPAVNHHRHFTKGVALLDGEQFAEAKLEFERALALDPDFTRAHVFLGATHGQLGEFEDAWEHYERARDLDPSNPTPHFWLGNILAEQGKPEEATVHFEKAIEVDPYYAPALQNLGLTKLQLGRPREAVAVLRKALLVQPRSPALHLYLSSGLIRIDRFEEGLKHLDHAAALNPEDWLSRGRLAWYLSTVVDARLRDGERAIALAQHACEKSNWKRPEPLDALAAAYAETGQFDLAVETATRAQRLAEEVEPKLAKSIGLRIDLYRARRPARMDPARSAVR